MIRQVCLALLFLASDLAFAGTKLPFNVLSKTSDLSGQKVLFKQGDFVVVKAKDATAKDFVRLFWINVEGAKQDFDARFFGEVLHTQPGLFHIVKADSEEDVERASAILHRIGQPCGALIQLTGSELMDERKILTPQPILPIAHQGEVAAMLSAVSSERIRATVQELSALHTRYHTSAAGKTVADTLVAMYQMHAQNRDDVEITTFSHGNTTPQPSLLVRIKGTTEPDELIILGSHLDSVNWMGGTSRPAPGADDNASGTATNLEIFRVMMEEGIRPQRTIEIHAYAAEEAGLVGSQDWAGKYKSTNRKVIAMVQHDMNLYSADGQAKIFLVSNNTNAALNRSLATLVDTYIGIPWEMKPLTGGNSDHYSWTRNGFAAAFPFEDPSNYNDHIHTEDDTIANSGHFSQAAAFAKLGLAYLSHFAGK
jgi:leucyl aminopeptidase